MSAARRTRARRDPAPARRAQAAPVRAVSLRRALSKLGVATRTDAEAMILAGRVRIGSRVVRDPAWRVDPALDALYVDGVLVRPARPQFWVLHKPAGYITTRRDERGRPTVYDLLPEDLPHVVAVGRLDGDSSGLLLFTNDTQVAARLTDPGAHVAKVYDVRLDRPIAADDARRLAAGVLVRGRRTRPAHVELVPAAPSAVARVTLVEGRNRQVRRMFASVGCDVLELRRVAIGPLRIGDLAEGAVRPLGPAEVEALLELRRRAPGGRAG